MLDIKQSYKESVIPKVMAEFGLRNRHAAPDLRKVVVSVNVGRHVESLKLDSNVSDTVISTLETITGQKPKLIKAKVAVSNFKVRDGATTAFMVTMRGDRMWSFMQRLVHLAIPRIKDFRGLKFKSFDREGNYSMGVTEQAIWPEINMARVNFTHGMNFNLIFEKSSPEKSEFLLRELGFPLVERINESLNAG